MAAAAARYATMDGTTTTATPAATAAAAVGPSRAQKSAREFVELLLMKQASLLVSPAAANKQGKIIMYSLCYDAHAMTTEDSNTVTTTDCTVDTFEDFLIA